MAAFTISGGLFFGATGDWFKCDEFGNPDSSGLFYRIAGAGVDGSINLIFTSGSTLSPFGFISEAPAGFTPTTSLVGSSGASGSLAGVADTVSITIAGATVTSISTVPIASNTPFLSLWVSIATITASLTDPSSSIIISPGQYSITGNYIIDAHTWYFNPDTNHYEYVEADPGDPWIPLEPDLNLISIDPAIGCDETTEVTLTGTGFGDDAIVLVDGIPAADVVVVDSNTITCTVPEHADGLVDITVINVDMESDTLVDGFEYGEPYWIQNTYVILSQTSSFLPPLSILDMSIIDVSPLDAPYNAETDMVITGLGFQDGASVEFISKGAIKSASSVVVDSEIQITCTSPTVPFKGLVIVRVSNPDGTAAIIQVTNSVETFLLQEFVQSCLEPDDLYVLFGIDAPAPAWWFLPGPGIYRYQPQSPGPAWVSSSAPAANGWYMSTNNFDGNVFVVKR